MVIYTHFNHSSSEPIGLIFLCVVLLTNNCKRATKSSIWCSVKIIPDVCSALTIGRTCPLWGAVLLILPCLDFFSFHFILALRPGLSYAAIGLLLWYLPLVLPLVPSHWCVSWQGLEIMVVLFIDSGAPQVSSYIWRNKYQGGITTHPWTGI